jgi:hypothetical protein
VGAPQTLFRSTTSPRSRRSWPRMSLLPSDASVDPQEGLDPALPTHKEAPSPSGTGREPGDVSCELSRYPIRRAAAFIQVKRGSGFYRLPVKILPLFAHAAGGS